MKTALQAKTIRLKVIKLLAETEQLKKDLANALQAQETLRLALEVQTKRAENLEDQNKISKLADGIQLAKQDKTELKNSINRYVREIDECLKLLNQIPNNN
jgi:hypothetical protein